MTRLLPGTLGDQDSLVDESHNFSLLEYPHYTRPLIFKDMKVPDILVSGNHEEIKTWRKQKSIERTIERRIDLISDENFNNSLEIKAIIKDSNQFEELKIDNENCIYPDW